MKNNVIVMFLSKAVKVDGEYVYIKNLTIDSIRDKLPLEITDVSKIVHIEWDLTRKGGIVGTGSSENGVVLFGEDKYSDYVQPYVDLWQAEKDRLEQEEQNAREEYLKYENRKERALDTIKEDYETVLSRGFVRTSLGFDADIKPDSTATLLGTQTGLVYADRTLDEGSEAPRTVFRDFYGLKRELDAVQVERLICEINGAQNYIRELKYKFKDQIKETYDNDSLNAVIKGLAFTTLDYSNLDEQGKPGILPFVEPAKSILERID